MSEHWTVPAPFATAPLPANLPGVYRVTRPNGQVIYIGKSVQLGIRVGAYRRNSRNHSGGRRLHHLADKAELLVAWAYTERDPHDVEDDLLWAHIDEHGVLPLVNRKMPRPRREAA